MMIGQVTEENYWMKTRMVFILKLFGWGQAFMNINIPVEVGIGVKLFRMSVPIIQSGTIVVSGSQIRN